MAGIRLGELLIEQGILTDSQVNHILAVQKASQRPFGDLAERLYGIDPKAIEDAWVEQYRRIAGVVDLDEQLIDIGCLRTLNRRQAWQFRMLPMHRNETEICVASDADSLVRAVNFATRSFEEPVFFQLAERQQLLGFLMKHYPVPEYIAQYAATL